MDLFSQNITSYYRIGDRVQFFSPTIGEVREYVVSDIYSHYRGKKQTAYKLTVANQNNEYWAVVLEKNLLYNNKNSTGYRPCCEKTIRLNNSQK